MKQDTLNELELAEILKIAREGESKIKQMSDRATIMAEKWRVKTSKHFKDTTRNDTVNS